MQTPKIHTFNPKNPIREFDVFILCKGLNSGKPLETPCPNCFVISCTDAPQRDFYKTLTFGLWKANYFQRHLTGSVIPFLRLESFKTILKVQADQIYQNKTVFVADVQKVKLIEQHEKIMYQQLALLAEAKKAMIYRHLKH